MKIDWNKELLFRDRHHEANAVVAAMCIMLILLISGFTCFEFAGSNSDPLNRLYRAGMEHREVAIVSEHLGHTVDEHSHTLAMTKTYSTAILQAGVILCLAAGSLLLSMVAVAVYRTAMFRTTIRLQKRYGTHKKCFRPQQHRLIFTIGNKACACSLKDAPPWWKYSPHAIYFSYPW